MRFSLFKKRATSKKPKFVSNCHGAEVEPVAVFAYSIHDYVKECEKGRLRCSVCKQPCELILPEDFKEGVQ